jgi:hypothetical protein
MHLLGNNAIGARKDKKIQTALAHQVKALLAWGWWCIIGLF